MSHLCVRRVSVRRAYEMTRLAEALEYAVATFGETRADVLIGAFALVLGHLEQVGDVPQGDLSGAVHETNLRRGQEEGIGLEEAGGRLTQPEEAICWKK